MNKEDRMQDLFLENKTIFVFLHVISAVVWVGGMIAMRFAAHQSFLEIENPLKRLERISHALKRLFTIVLPFVILLLITAIFMINGYELLQTEFSSLSYVKEGIWSVMFLNLLVMMFRRNKAERLLNEGDATGAKAQLGLIGNVMVPVNILLGIVAIYLGTTLSGVL